MENVINREIDILRSNLQVHLQAQIDNDKFELWGEFDSPLGDENHWATHTHASYNDKKFWGHYVWPQADGTFSVTVYLQEQIVGNPMTDEGERGESFVVEGIFLEKVSSVDTYTWNDQIKETFSTWLERAKEVEAQREVLIGALALHHQDIEMSLSAS